MIRLISRATLLAAGGLMAATVVLAGVPNATNSTISAAPQGGKILLAGHNAAGTTTDSHPNYVAMFTKLITVRDAANNPVNNSVVTLNFSSCYVANGLFLGAIQPGLTVNGGAHTVSAVTNASGVATFKVCGGGAHVGGGSDPDAPTCIAVTADGVPLGNLDAMYFDMNGLDCYNISDFGLFSSNFNAPYLNNTTPKCITNATSPNNQCHNPKPSGPPSGDGNYRCKTDYNNNGCIASGAGPNNDIGDFGIFVNAYSQNDFGGNNCANGGSSGPH